MKPFVKMDTVTYIIFLLVSIIIPPLFIINLVVFLVQIIPQIIIATKENKENKEWEEFERKSREEMRKKELEERLKDVQEKQQNDFEENVIIQQEEENVENGRNSKS